jgi:hypothetical protein
MRVSRIERRKRSPRTCIIRSDPVGQPDYCLVALDRRSENEEDTVTESGENVHGRYLIRTFSSGSKVSVRAFTGERSVAFTEAKSMDEAITAIGNLLDDRDGRERAARQNGIPTAQEFADAFGRLAKKVGKNQWLMLRALHSAPSRTMTATELVASGGYARFRTGNEILGRLGRMIAEDLEFDPRLRPDGSPSWISVLATGSDVNKRESDGDWPWTMRPQVADCLTMMDLRHPAP